MSNYLDREKGALRYLGEPSAVQKLLQFVERADNIIGNIRGLSITIQFDDGSHRVWVANNGNLDATYLQFAMKEASESSPTCPPFLLMGKWSEALSGLPVSQKEEKANDLP